MRGDESDHEEGKNGLDESLHGDSNYACKNLGRLQVSVPGRAGRKLRRRSVAEEVGLCRRSGALLASLKFVEVAEISDDVIIIANIRLAVLAHTWTPCRH